MMPSAARVWLLTCQLVRVYKLVRQTNLAGSVQAVVIRPDKSTPNAREDAIMSEGSSELYIPDTAPLAEAPTELHRNALKLSGLVILGIAYMGLALAAYFNFGIMEGLTGPVVPLAFIAVALLMLPTAISYAVMNSRRPSAGSTLTWLWEATARRASASGSAGSWLSPISSARSCSR